MFGTGAWIWIALIAGFYLGATLMSLLSIAGDGDRDDVEHVALKPDRRPGPARAVKAGRTA